VICEAFFAGEARNEKSMRKIKENATKRKSESGTDTFAIRVASATRFHPWWK